ncbi:MAG: response regulator [Spirochaetia bacterium]|nr:response regulator [Spirochaetia bacterium]
MSAKDRQESSESNGKPLILIVDDDQDILMMTSRILNKAGFEVIEGSSGEECLNLAREHKPELILLDVMLPDINGTEVCQRIKNDRTLKDSFLILLSGQRTSSDEQADGLTCGADGYIARPISQRELIARVEIMLRLRRAQMETKAHAEALTLERNKLTSLFDGISDIIYVVDPNSYELLYSNPAFRETFGEHHEYEKCYRVLHDHTKPCSFCDVNQTFGDNCWNHYSWEYFNEKNSRWYRCINRSIHWPNGNIVCLQQMSDITEQKKLENELRQTVKEKDFLMKELNHRVKNNLNMVSSLITLKNDEIEYDLSDLTHQIKAIGLIHEKLYQTESLTEICCRDYFDDLLNSIFSSFTTRRVRIEKDIEDICVSTKTAMSLGLIINEIATNAIKYGFNEKEEAVFFVMMKKDIANSEYQLSLSNTGNPFPEDIDIKNTNTLGLRLVDALVAQIDGALELQKKPNPIFTIRFPDAEE